MPDATQQPIKQPGGAASSDAVFPPLLKSDVLACQFSHWYPRFRRCAPKATVIRPLPEDEPLVDFLEADGLFLPEGSGPMGSVPGVSLPLNARSSIRPLPTASAS